MCWAVVQSVIGPLPQEGDVMDGALNNPIDSVDVSEGAESIRIFA